MYLKYINPSNSYQEFNLKNNVSLNETPYKIGIGKIIYYDFSP